MEALQEDACADEAPDIFSSSAEYARRFAGPVGDWFLKVQTEGVLRLLGTDKEISILDVGGGHGQIARPLSQHGFKITVLGSSAECAFQIGDLVKNARCRFVQGSIVDPPLPEKSFDVVTSVRIVSHLERWQDYLASLCRIARRAVIIDYPLARPVPFFSGLFFKLKRGVEKNTRTYRSFADREIVREFNKNDFILAQRYAQFFWPMVMHRVVGQPRLSAALERAAKISGVTGLVGSPVIIKMVRHAA